jgi:hypothetical protein
MTFAVYLKSDAFQEAPPAGCCLPGEVRVGWGVSEVMAAFVASLNGASWAVVLRLSSLKHSPIGAKGRKDVGEVVHHL